MERGLWSNTDTPNGFVEAQTDTYRANCVSEIASWVCWWTLNIAHLSGNFQGQESIQITFWLPNIHLLALSTVSFYGLYDNTINIILNSHQPWLLVSTAARIVQCQISISRTYHLNSSRSLLENHRYLLRPASFQTLPTQKIRTL